MSNFHPIVQTIRGLIEHAGFEYQYFEHEAVRTSEEAAQLRPEFLLSQGAKALLIRAEQKDGSRFFVQVVVPGDAKFDSKKIKNILGVKKITFANREEADVLTAGIEFGGVPPFGNLFDIPVYVDRGLLDHDQIIFNCGDRRVSIAMNSTNWQSLVQPVVIDAV